MLVAAGVILVLGAAVGLATWIGRERPVDGVATSTEVVFDSSAAELPPSRSMIGGVYRTDDLGTRVLMDLADIWLLERHEAGAIELSDDGGIVSIIRPTGLADPTELAADDPMFTWPSTDLDGWLDSVSSSVTIVEADGEGGGLRVFDLQAAEGLCPGSAPCLPFLTTRGTFDVSVGSSEQTRVWWFTMEPFAPMVVVATGPASTIQNADILVRSMGFGFNGAHPLAQQEIWEAGFDAELPAGRVALPALGGLEFDLPSPVAMRQSDDAVQIDLTSLTGIEVLIVDRAADGTSVTTVAEAMAVLDSLADLTPAGSLETPLGEMVVVDVSEGPTNSADVSLGNAGHGWLLPQSGRLWMVEVENGLLLVSAGMLEDSILEDPTLRRDVIDFGEAVASTIRLGGG